MGLLSEMGGGGGGAAITRRGSSESSSEHQSETLQTKQYEVHFVGPQPIILTYT